MNYEWIYWLQNNNIRKKDKHPFIIVNTDSSDILIVLNTDGTHWWSILDIEPRTDLFFDTFSVDRLKSFIIQDDKKVIEKILVGTEQLTRTDNKITLVNIKFNLSACKYLSTNELDNLSDRAWDSFYFIQYFGNKLKHCDGRRPLQGNLRYFSNKFLQQLV